MPRTALRPLLAAVALVAALSVAPVSQAISLCINCTCSSACDLRCWNGFAVDTCSHWLCVDFCFPGPLSSETVTAEEAAPSAGETATECLEVAPVETEVLPLEM